jgi:hypothetical protein
MTTYEINDGTNDITVAITELLKKDDDSGFLNLIAIKDPSTKDLQTKLNEINDAIKIIKTVNSSDGIVINNATEIAKIHFLAASIYKVLVDKCLEQLGKDWDNIKSIIEANLKLEALGAGPTDLKHFYINPVVGTIDDIDNILMFQLLKELIKNDMKPENDDVLDFLSKIDSSWCVDIDKAKLDKIITEAQSKTPATNIYTYFVEKCPSRPLARLGATFPDDETYKLSVTYKKIDELQIYIVKMKDDFVGKKTTLENLIKNDGTGKIFNILDDIDTKHTANNDDVDGFITEIIKPVDNTSIYQIYNECKLLKSKLEYLSLLKDERDYTALLTIIKPNIITLLQNSNTYLGVMKIINDRLAKIFPTFIKNEDKEYRELSNVVQPTITLVTQLKQFFK